MASNGLQLYPETCENSVMIFFQALKKNVIMQEYSINGLNMLSKPIIGINGQ